MGYWLICTKQYEHEGITTPVGTMDYYTSSRPCLSEKWRRATEDEVNNREHFNVNLYYKNRVKPNNLNQ